ncbi:DUF1998 domain-containing protein [Gordonia hongkongensis]|uniref:DUF1998 domain-containing protein n=2 Tax=Gordonia hongkongensis TaxID=1701090 RepID=A0ABT6C3I3_9ACTN|nr:DUF1998 domain-containing protein [Gordonia hongkongensis]MDF6103644.1 DUF1998 domain-containing protein [Gordonia hongkongensis]
MRQSQTLSPFGVGAILDLQGESLVACDIYRWGSNKGDLVSSPRLLEALRVAQLYAAPSVDSQSHGRQSKGVPYARFPSWLFCNKCRAMIQWRRSMEQDGKRPNCPHCTGNRQLAPMRWIQICPKGHMDDVDWFWWTHQGTTEPNQRQCKDRTRLEFQTSGKGGAGGLDTLAIYCKACRARKSLMGITSTGSGRRVNFKCSGRQPWQSREDAVQCTEEVKIVQRGASNVYFPNIVSSIEIPSPSNSETHSELALEIQNDPFFPAALGAEGMLLDHMVTQLASNHGTEESFIRALIADEQRRQAGNATVVDAPPGDLLAEEWAAFLSPTEDPDHPDFVTRHVKLRESGSSADLVLQKIEDRVSKVVLADRIREVRALLGFNRVTPAVQTMVRVDLGKGLPWLPAIDVRGEGIFIALDEARLSVWEQDEHVAARAAEIDSRLGRSFQEERLRRQTGPSVLPRYILLHTLAHLLIRRLAYDTGYSASSLRERIYAKAAEPGQQVAPQAGVLIYTAAGDSEGTLGGLVRQGEAPRFATTLIEAINDCGWCSADPLCGESKATSFDNLNLAACHACVLVSETSCECGNFLLDRVMVVGNGEVPGFFEPVLEASLEEAAKVAE